MNKISLAGCIIKKSNRKILLLHRNTPKRTQWEIPGGKQKLGETLQETAIRETKEELGVVVEIVKELGNHKFTEDGCVYNYTWFQAKILSGKLTIKEPNTFDNFSYFSKGELIKKRHQLSQNTQNFLNSFKNTTK